MELKQKRTLLQVDPDVSNDGVIALALVRDSMRAHHLRAAKA